MTAEQPFFVPALSTAALCDILTHFYVVEGSFGPQFWHEYLSSTVSISSTDKHLAWWARERWCWPETNLRLAWDNWTDQSYYICYYIVGKVLGLSASWASSWVLCMQLNNLSSSKWIIYSQDTGTCTCRRKNVWTTLETCLNHISFLEYFPNNSWESFPYKERNW